MKNKCRCFEKIYSVYQISFIVPAMAKSRFYKRNISLIFITFCYCYHYYCYYFNNCLSRSISLFSFFFSYRFLFYSPLWSKNILGVHPLIASHFKRKGFVLQCGAQSDRGEGWVNTGRKTWKHYVCTVCKQNKLCYGNKKYVFFLRKYNFSLDLHELLVKAQKILTFLW